MASIQGTQWRVKGMRSPLLWPFFLPPVQNKTPPRQDLTEREVPAHSDTSLGVRILTQDADKGSATSVTLEVNDYVCPSVEHRTQNMRDANE